MNEKEREAYQQTLSELDLSGLLTAQYTVKRGKDPEKHLMITDEFAHRLELKSKRDAVAHWVIQLVGSEIVVKDREGPVKVVKAQVNARGNAAIIQLEDEIRTRYLEYKGEEDAKE